MAKTLDRSNTNSQYESKASQYFLCCFGFSSKPSSKRSISSILGHDDHNKNNSNIPQRSTRRWLIFPKTSANIKTAPFDSRIPKKPDTRTKVPFSKSKSTHDKLPSKPQTQPLSQPLNLPNHQTPPKTRGMDEEYDGSKEGINMGKQNNAGQVEFPLNDTCQLKRLPFQRKVRSFSHPGTADDKEVGPSGPVIAISHSVSLPAPNRRALENSPQPCHEGKAWDPVKGVAVITVILTIMVFWGRLCAILCTSAWFYFGSSLSTSAQTQNKTLASASGLNGQNDFSSQVYKKKVILEGLLERTRRRSS